MRQFILGGNVAGLTSGEFDKSKFEADAGKIGVGYYKEGVATFDNGSKIKEEGFIALIRKEEDGGPVVLPLYKNHFTYVKGEYEAATTFEATLTIPEPKAMDKDFTVIAVKKGVKFNERNKWTAQVHLRGDETAEKIAEKIVAYYMDENDNPRYGIKCEASGADLTFTSELPGVDWEIIPADDLIGLDVTVNEIGFEAYGDAKYVKDLANKAAADVGFEYTYQEPSVYLYPKYPINPLASQDAQDTGFTIFTLRFAEPRKVKTVDDVVHQIVQVAFPTGSAGISTFEAACKKLADEE